MQATSTLTFSTTVAEGEQPGGLLVESEAAASASGCSVPDATIKPVVVPAYHGSARETGGQFVLDQNCPNPFVDETTIPFTLINDADVRLELFDPAGRKVVGVVRNDLCAGEQHITLNLHGLNLRAGTYAYELQVTSRYGTFRQRTAMTVANS